MSRLVDDIDAALDSGRLEPEFGPEDVMRACPGWAYHTVRVFLPKHRRGNPGGHAIHFERNPDGTYSRWTYHGRVSEPHAARRQRIRDRAALAV